MSEWRSEGRILFSILTTSDILMFIPETVSKLNLNRF